MTMKANATEQELKLAQTSDISPAADKQICNPVTYNTSLTREMTVFLKFAPSKIFANASAKSIGHVFVIVASYYLL